MRWIPTALCSLALFSAPACAEWREASSDHFIIYGDQGEKTLRSFAERLELFHSAMTVLFRQQPTKPSPSNRVTVFVVSNQERVNELASGNSRYLAGFYRPRAGSSIAVIPQLTRTSSQLELSPETILLHEYAHHFMAGLATRAYPRWFSEGFAEFFAGVRFQTENISLGMPATHRAYEFVYAKRVPIREMLDFRGPKTDPKSGHDAFYAQSWTLFHYLTMAPERAGQLSKYQQLLGSGQSALEAAEAAFGDLDKLDGQMRSYGQRKRLEVMLIPRKPLPVSAINIRVLSAGAAEMMPVVIRSRSGESSEQALALLPEARRIAALHLSDPAVMVALAEAERDAGNNDEAIVAADQALALDPTNVTAYLHKGFALWNKVESGQLSDDSWPAVRQLFVRANQIENDHPVPLVQFYRSYLARGEQPTTNAIDGLAWAMQLAPFDPSLRWLVVQQLIADNRLQDAVQTLAPLAYSAHRGEHTDRALALLRDLEGRIAAAAESEDS